MTNQTLTTSEARTNLYSLVDQASEGLSFTITKGGKPKAVLMSNEEFESWLETLDIMRDKDLMKSIKQSEKELREGKVFPLEELFKNE